MTAISEELRNPSTLLRPELIRLRTDTAPSDDSNSDIEPGYSCFSSQPIQKTAPDYAKLLEKMFSLESVEKTSPLTPTELRAEDIFQKTVSRTRDGRFIVGLPLAQDPNLLGSTKKIAFRRFIQLETRHSKNPEEKTAYANFMAEYLELGHMELVPRTQEGMPSFYLPHHSVHRPGDPPAKIRVVFNASQKSTSGLSLNDILLPGPRLQLDISEVVTKFRQDKYVFTADVKQMFRQIEHRPEDSSLLRILWRPNDQEAVQEYWLKTVTYGTACAPFLACRVLQELAMLHSNSHPNAANILRTRTYVDDLNGGGDTVIQALAVRHEIQELLNIGKFELRKWAANDRTLLKDIPEEHILPAAASISLDEHADSELKVLGLSWNAKLDAFHFRLAPVLQIQTKRDLASQIARVLDPLGWLIPIAVKARTIFRLVCQGSYSWDDQLPSHITEEWAKLASELPLLETLEIPRYMPVRNGELYLVAFGDASEQAYACVLYSVLVTGTSVTVNLVTSKARIAPVKPVSLPRLELCASHLLAATVQKYLPLFPDLQGDHIMAFSDSTITLSWITAEPAPVWKVFVGNRVASILEVIPKQNWYHVPSNENPADCASRGVMPSDLASHKLWWNGPSWLSQLPFSWPLRRIRPELDEELVKCEARPTQSVSLPLKTSDNLCPQLEERFSNYFTLQSIIAWIIRFKFNASHSSERRAGPLTMQERIQADMVLLKRAQSQGLAEELVDAQREKPQLRLTKTLGLFIDTQGILRVGGRLRNSNLPDDSKNPALLPAKHPTTTLLIQWAHRCSLHVGPNGTLAKLRQRYWICNGRNVVRRVLDQCVQCRRVNPRPYQPIMGDLPKERLTTIVPFHITGVDYAGPFHVKSSTLRAAKVLEAYLAIFVCFSTKAVHIEVVADLSTQSFLLAYQIFVSLRGQPAEIWSDNGRNFVGAANELARLRHLLRDQDFQLAVHNEALKNGSLWHFIPPRSTLRGIVGGGCEVG
ncbi:Pao retrotransposon peptidase [Nesidiocoris tenuis]|uniref:Pao retrotransposon peptidase n=2 Tax=Nesidiocoris tenuis TaxID=355587 RepID=A0ABN7AER5_9HEMI|nr:Pao retrotransposon peptidase [Nesidiocoris tenuis]